MIAIKFQGHMLKDRGTILVKLGNGFELQILNLDKIILK